MGKLRTMGKGCLAVLSGVGVTTLSDDLSDFLRSVADWVDAGGSIQLILWAGCGALWLWFLFDVWQYVQAQRKARRVSVSTEPTPAVAVNPHEEQTRIIADRAASDFRTNANVVRAVFYALVNPTTYSKPENKTPPNKEDSND